MRSFVTEVTDVSSDMKIRDYLKKRLGFSTSIVGKVKYDGVLLNGVAVHMRAIVKNGDKVEILFPEEHGSDILPIDLPLDVLYEDEYILVVNKPKNMPIHPSRGNSLPTLANAVAAYFDKPFVYRVITRLDRDTSGIVLIAKDRLTAARLSNAMKQREIKKYYNALVVGVPSKVTGRIDAPIDRECEGEMRRIVTENGKNSITDYRLIKAYGNLSLLECQPITGRTHQIRVHLAYIGHPLYADFLYGKRVQDKTYFLHCSRLEFTHPYTNESLIITSEIDEGEIYDLQHS